MKITCPGNHSTSPFDVFKENELEDLLVRSMASKIHSLTAAILLYPKFDEKFSVEQVVSICRYSLYYHNDGVYERMRKHPQFEKIEPIMGI